MPAMNLNRGDWRRHAIDLADRVFVPALWLVTLGYQWIFAAMLLDGASQTMAFVFRNRYIEPTTMWTLLYGAYGSLSLLTWSLWLATCPRAITALLCRREHRVWAQRRVAKVVLLIFVLSTALQSTWIVLLFLTQGADVDILDAVLAHVSRFFEGPLPAHVLINSLLPLAGWTMLLVLTRSDSRNAYYWLAAAWSLLIIAELNFALALSATRMLTHITFRNVEHIEIVGRSASIAVVLVALLFEYRQVWQAPLDRMLDRKGGKSLVPSAKTLTPDP